MRPTSPTSAAAVPPAHDVRAARYIATDASFQAFTNCYLREVDSGTWHDAASWQASSGLTLSQGEAYVVELELDRQVLALGVRFRSRVGRHALTVCFQRPSPSHPFLPVDLLSAQLMLIDHLYREHPQSERRLELLVRVIQSHQVMAACVAPCLSGKRRSSLHPSPGGGFIESEQSIVFGHWLHPTPKSRQGIHGWQSPYYTPERGGRFQLEYFAAHRDIVEQGSVTGRSAEAISQQIASVGATKEELVALAQAVGDDRCLVPIHPLQATWLRHQDYVRELLASGKLLDLGPRGAEFTPTSSVRTVYSESLDFMAKLSIPVKLTNSLRINMRTELDDSVNVSKILRLCGVDRDFPTVRIIEDPAYITIGVPGRAETGFEAIFRDNPFRMNRGAPDVDPVHSVAALVEEPVATGEHSLLMSLIHVFVAHEGRDIAAAGLAWFDAYWRRAVEPVIRIYDVHGIGLEAHQQNSLLSFEPSGLPKIFHYRDVQGLTLCRSQYDRFVELLPELEHEPQLFEDRQLVRDGLCYYLVFNQLFSVINRFGLDGIVDEQTLLEFVRGRLIDLRPEMGELGTEFIDLLLEQEALPCKANLLTRLEDRDELQAENELAVYTLLDNPLLHVPHAAAPGGRARQQTRPPRRKPSARGEQARPDVLEPSR
ncbi:MAG: IucA/IucC family protein [Myxococcota bacterium]